MASLEALQEAALGRHDGPVTEWLEGRGLADSPRLAQQLRVDDGWERAVETVLGHYLEAVCVDGIDDVVQTLDGLTHGAVSLLEADLAVDGARPVGGRTDLLGKRVNGPAGLAGLLAGVGAVEDLPRALAPEAPARPGRIRRDPGWHLAGAGAGCGSIGPGREGGVLAPGTGNSAAARCAGRAVR